jgi:hypothetical protein
MEENRPHLHLQPGDRVCLKMDVYDGNDYGRDLVILLASRGSIWIVISFEEYRAHEEEMHEEFNFRRSSNFGDRLLGNKKVIEKGFKYPIKFEYVAPPEVKCDILSCGIGTIHFIDAFIYKLKHDAYELVIEKIDRF